MKIDSVKPRADGLWALLVHVDLHAWVRMLRRSDPRAGFSSLRYGIGKLPLVEVAKSLLRSLLSSLKYTHAGLLSSVENVRYEFNIRPPDSVGLGDGSELLCPSTESPPHPQIFSKSPPHSLDRLISSVASTRVNSAGLLTCLPPQRSAWD